MNEVLPVRMENHVQTCHEPARGISLHCKHGDVLRDWGSHTMTDKLDMQANQASLRVHDASSSGHDWHLDRRLLLHCSVYVHWDDPGPETKRRFTESKSTVRGAAASSCFAPGSLQRAQHEGHVLTETWGRDQSLSLRDVACKRALKSCTHLSPRGHEGFSRTARRAALAFAIQKEQTHTSPHRSWWNAQFVETVIATLAFGRLFKLVRTATSDHSVSTPVHYY